MSEEVRSLLELSDKAREKTLMKTSDKRCIELANTICVLGKYSDVNPELEIELENEMNKMFDATRYLNNEKYESEFLSKTRK